MHVEETELKKALSILDNIATVVAKTQATWQDHQEYRAQLKFVYDLLVKQLPQEQKVA